MPRPRPTTTKHCPGCQEIKPVGEFHSSEKYDGGYSARCIPCTRLQNKARWEKNPEKMRETARLSYHKNKDKHIQSTRARTRAVVEKMRSEDPARYRAKKFFDTIKNRGYVAKDVTREYLTELFLTVTHCQCCGVLMELGFQPLEERRATGHLWNPLSPSVDRVNNDKGYTRNNIAIICWECNHRKTDLTLNDLAMFEEYIRRFGDV